MSTVLATIALSAQRVFTLDASHKTKQVLVGVLAQPTSERIRSTAYNPEVVWSYVAGSYVDFVSQSGAMPVLVPYDITEEHLDYFIDTVDMFLLPGGAADLQYKINPTD